MNSSDEDQYAADCEAIRRGEKPELSTTWTGPPKTLAEWTAVYNHAVDISQARARRTKGFEEVSSNGGGTMKAKLTTDCAARKGIPIATGFLDYFPLAVAEVARLSAAGNDKHNPGEPMHWSRGKSSDHADCLVRHQMERGTIDTDGFLHDAKVAWRALAQLQIALENAKGS